mgnify:CR=1 FL=1
MKKIKIDSLSDLPQVAQAVIDSLDGRSVVVFRAGMGAGKTTLISRIVALLGAEDTVTSPTFALVNQYEGTQHRIYHFDFYRIKKLDEAYDMGCEDYFYSGAVCFIEWPEMVEDLLPGNTVWVDIKEEADGSRSVVIAE